MDTRRLSKRGIFFWRLISVGIASILLWVISSALRKVGWPMYWAIGCSLVCIAIIVLMMLLIITVLLAVDDKEYREENYPKWANFFEYFLEQSLFLVKVWML